MASVNRVILLGNLGRDPEVRYLANGDAVANFSIATTESWKDKDGAKQEKTEWHRIVLWRRLPEIAGEYLKKGSACYVEGKLQTREWEKEGVNYSTEIVAERLQLLGKPNSQRNTADDPADRQTWPAGRGGDTDDDVPF